MKDVLVTATKEFAWGFRSKLGLVRMQQCDVTQSQNGRGCKGPLQIEFDPLLMQVPYSMLHRKASREVLRIYREVDSTSSLFQSCHTRFR